MVIKNTFVGTLTEEEQNKSETISLPLISDTSMVSVTHYPVWSELLLDSLEKTFIDAGYSPIINKEQCSIEIWGFKFYTIVTGSSSIKYQQTYFKGISTGANTHVGGGNNRYSYLNVDSSGQYNFIITLRGSDNIFSSTISGNGNSNYEVDMFWLAKSIYLPTNEDGIVGGGIPQLDTECVQGFLLSDLYNPKIKNRKLPVLNYLCNNEYGLGIGYPKVNLHTIGFEFLLKDTIYKNQQYITAGQYYKLGNEIYYAHKNENSYGNLLFYKVDNIPDEESI